MTWRPPPDRCRCGRAIEILERWCRRCAAKEADRVVGQFVKRRDGACTVPKCRKGSLEWAHVHGRAHLRIRWDPENALTLCHDHHRYFTDNPRAWRDFVEWIRPGLWEDLLGRRYRARPDVAEIIRTYGGRKAA